MKKILLIASMTAGLTACASSPAPEEDSRLKEAYSACINTAQGSPEKIEYSAAKHLIPICISFDTDKK